MQGYQFAHMELYSRQCRTGASGGGTALRKNGQRAWSVDQILDEVERRPGACEHVIEGRPPPEVLPGDVSSIDDLRDAHAKASSVWEKAFTSEITDGQGRKTGRKKKVQRKLRVDASTLYTCVVSLPVETVDALASPALRRECMAVLGAAMEHERQRVVGLGGRLMCGVVHWDEAQVHMHLYALDMDLGRVDHLHPGRVAKKIYHADNENSGLPAEDRARNGNRAYREAMRGWQDDLHNEVFSDAGLLRFGPKRFRLSRAEYNELKAAKEEVAQTRQAQQARRQERQELKDGWTRLGEAQREHAELVDEQEADLDRQRDEIAAEEGMLEMRGASLAARQDRLVRDKEALKAEREEAAKEKANATMAKGEAEATMAAVEGLARGLLVVVGDGENADVTARQDAPSNPAWQGILDRIAPASARALAVARSMAGWTSLLREKAKQKGLEEAREQARREAKVEAQAEVDRLRAALDPALSAAGRIATIARSFVARLQATDGQRMTAQIDAVLGEASRASMEVRRAEAKGELALGDRPRSSPARGSAGLGEIG